MKSLWKLIPFMKPYRRQAILAMLLLMGMVFFDLLIPRLTQRVVDQGITPRNLQVIGSTSLLMLGAALLSAAFAVGNTLLSVRVGQGMGADMRSALVRQVQTFSFGNLDRLQTGQLLVRTTSDVTQVQTIFQMSLRILTRAPLWVLGSIIMLAITNPTLALIWLALVPIIWTIIWLVMIRGRPLFARVQARLDVLNQVLQENLAGVRVVKAFVRTDYENARFERANDALTRENLGVMQLMATLLPTMQMFVSLGVAGVIWFGGRQAIAGAFPLGKIMASINYMTYSLFPMLMLGGMIGPLSAADASAGRMLEVLENQADVQDRPQTTHLPQVQGRVVFENVSFEYNGADGAESVLNEINLVAEPGQRVALLGATGSGKSTLISLIPRFYDVNRGRITLDGVDVRDLSLDQLRLQMGISLQEAVLFTGTVRDNIRYGRPEASEEEVVAAAKAAQAHDFIASFPQGYDTMIGQRGVNLSGGQKQRIAIARALLVQPKVLILDDSTSAVDVETEARIEQEIEAMTRSQTRFVIAQRISTVLNADKIIVLDRGRIVAEGAHDELIASSPIYQEIYQSQLGDGGNTHGQ